MAKRGRPVGSKTESVTVEVIATSCPKCGSGRRSAYVAGGTRTQKINGTLSDGRRYCAIIWRTCKCIESDCGQVRREKTFVLSAD